MPDFSFHPELFEARGKALEALAAAGYAWFSDYSSVGPDHENYGLEVCGIRDRECAQGIAAVLLRTFPGWRYGTMYEREWWTREPGWIVIIQRSGNQLLRDRVGRRQDRAPGPAPPRTISDEMITLDCGPDRGAHTLSELAGRLDDAFGRGVVRIALDLSRLEHMNSVALGQLVRMKKRAAERGGDLVLVRPTRNVARILRILSLNEYLRIFDSAQDAARHFAKGVPGAAEPRRARRERPGAARPAGPGVVLFGLLDRPEAAGVVHGAGRVTRLDPQGVTFDWPVPDPLSKSAERGLDASNFDARVIPGVRMRLKIRSGNRFVEAEGLVLSVERRTVDGVDTATFRVRPDTER